MMKKQHCSNDGNDVKSSKTGSIPKQNPNRNKPENKVDSNQVMGLLANYLKQQKITTGVNENSTNNQGAFPKQNSNKNNLPNNKKPQNDTYTAGNSQQKHYPKTHNFNLNKNENQGHIRNNFSKNSNQGNNKPQFTNQNKQQPHNFGNQPNISNHTNQFKPNPTANNQIINISINLPNNTPINIPNQNPAIQQHSTHPTASRNYTKRGRGNGNFHSNNPSNSAVGNTHGQTRGGGVRGNGRGGQYKGNKPSNNHTHTKKSEASASSNIGLEMMSKFIELQKKEMKTKSVSEKQNTKEETVSVMFYTTTKK